MNKVRVYIRVFILFLSLPPVVGILLLIHLVTSGNYKYLIGFRMKYAQFILWVLGVRVKSQGVPPSEPVLFIANHRSWLDPVLTFHAPMLVIAKAEVSKWPLIGFGVRLCGAIYVKREEKASRKNALAQILRNWKLGNSVLIYAEGTTNSLSETKEFRKGGFWLASENNIPIVPITLEYKNQSDHWVGADLFVPHAIRSFGKKRTEVKVHYGKIIRGNDPEVLLEKTQNWIDGQLRGMRKDWFIENNNQASIDTA